MNTIALISQCDIGWLELLGWGLIPFVLGWLLKHFMGGNDNNNDHHDEIIKLRRQLDECRASKKSDTSISSKFKSQLSSKDNEIASLTASLSAATSGNKNDSRRVKELEARLDELQGLLDDCSERRTLLQEQNDDLYAEIKSLGSVKTDTKDLTTDLKADLGNLEKENKDLKNKLNRLETDLHAARLAAKKKTSGSKEALEQEIVELKKQLVGARAAQAHAESMAARPAQVEVPVTPIAATPKSAPAALVDDLTKIEGLGPKTNELFQGQGITSYRQVADMNEDSLNDALAKGGDRFRILDPFTWPKQAQMIIDGDQEKLDAYQDYLIAGRDPARYAAQYNVEDLDYDNAKEVFGKTVKANDLKMVEGIGPKIEELLNNNGVNTWAELSATTREVLRKLVDDNGYAYMAPESWPKQAAMLAAGKWAEIKKWQDEHDGGRE